MGVPRREEVRAPGNSIGAEAGLREQERKAALARTRADRLLAQAAGFRQAHEIRAFVAAVRTAAVSVDPPMALETLDRWCAWALAEADRLDPIASGALASEISEGQAGG